MVRPSVFVLFCVACTEPRRPVASELFDVPASSAMVPTLVEGDRVEAERGPIAAGMVVVHRWTDGRTFIKRVVAVGGQTVTETERGIAIDGVPLVTEELPGDYPYVYDFSQERSGKLVREQLGARRYLTLHRHSASDAFARSKQRGAPGTWTVPPGSVFLLGDNRDDSTDSRYLGPIPGSSLVGVVTKIHSSSHRDRVGTSIE